MTDTNQAQERTEPIEPSANPTEGVAAPPAETVAPELKVAVPEPETPLPELEAVAPEAGTAALEPETPLPELAAAALEPEMEPGEPTVDLTLNAAYRGAAFIDAAWNWPSVVRAAIHLCDYVAADPVRFARPLLPALIALDNEGQLQVEAATVAEAAPFAAPEVADAAETAAVEITAVYHVAALAHYLLVGYPPIGNVTLVDEAAPDTPAALKSVLVRALAVDPKQRTATLADLRTQLYYVLDPPAWFEEEVPKLPIDDETKTRLIDSLNRGQLSWYRLRDRIPWQRVGRARKRLTDSTAHPKIGRALTIAGVLLVLLIYLTLLTDLI
jgi:hypothetical protein